MLMLERHLKFNRETIEAENLCSRFSAKDLATIGNLVWDGFVRDKASRREWEKRNSAGMDLAMQIQQAKNFPWPNCANIVFPLVSIASLQFWTRSASVLMRGPSLVHYKAYGLDGKKTPSAVLLGEHMSWQVREEDQAWREQHNRLFINVGIVGTAFIKTRYSSILKHNVSEMVMARDLVLDYFATDVNSCRRKTQVLKKYRNEIWSNAKRGIYKDVTEEAWFQQAARVDIVKSLEDEDHDKRIGLEAPQGDLSTPFTVLEQHCWLDLDGDGYEEPYRVVLEAASKCVLRIAARIEREEDIEKTESGVIISIRADEDYTKYGFIPAPDGGIYDLGLGTLLGPLNETVNTAINQIFDAGTSNMLGGGFTSSGGKLKSGVYTRTPGEWKIIKGASDDIRKSMISYPEIPISDVLFKILQFIVGYADRLAGTTQGAVGENPGQNTPAQTYQGMIEQGTQVFKAILEGMWDSMKEEFKKLHLLNARYLPASQQFGSGDKRITAEMYKTDPSRLAPVADPNLISDQQRIQRSMMVRQGAHSIPGYNIEEVERDWLDAIGVEDNQRIFPGPYSEWAKAHPLPNPKLQVEEFRAQVKMQGFQEKKWELLAKLSEQRGQIRAQIDLLRAQAAKLISEIGADRAAQALERFDVIMTHMTTMMQMMNEKAEGLAGDVDGQDQAGGAGGAQGSPGGQRSVALPSPAGGGDQGSVGGGQVQQ